MKILTLPGVMAGLCLLCITKNITAQTTITGTVRNTIGEPLANATITVVKTNKGAITNARGTFTLSNITAKDQLRVSLIGYATQTLPVNNQTNITITLKEAVRELDKVVVQAYGTTSDRLRTGNISKVTAADIAKQPVMNVLNILQGLVPGAEVNNTSGYASGVVKVELRGRNLINSRFSSDPLYVIDGVPMTIQNLTNQDSYEGGSIGVNQAGLMGPANGQSFFFNINPNDIESIEVLKDADATAIYGSRAANGVILINTKTGKTGKTEFSVNAYTGVTQVVKTYEMLNTQQYIAMRREALKNDGLPVDAQTAPDLVIWDTTRYTNWQNAILKSGHSSNMNATLSGGNQFTRFRISGDYSTQSDLLVNSGANKRGSFSINLNQKSKDQRFGSNLSAFYTASKVSSIYMPFGVLLPPNAPPIWDANGKLNYAGWQPLDGNFPFESLLQPYSSQAKVLNSSLVLKYEIAKGLVINTSLGYSNITGEQYYLTPKKSQNPAYNLTGFNYFGNSNTFNWITEPKLEYTTFLFKGKLSAMAGGSYQNNATASYSLQGQGYINDAFIGSVGNAPIRIASNAKEYYRYLAGFGRVTYNWRDKYIANINWRRDGSSKFGPGRQFGNFGSVGGVWIFSEENWIKSNLKFLSFGKIRSSYGTTGGDQIGNYQYLSQWAFGYPGISYNGQLVLNPQSHYDSLLQWQINKKLEVALALGFLEDRIFLDISWYRNRCNSQLVSFPTPLFSGFPSVVTNSPANVENRGLEFALTLKPIQGDVFNWEVKANISFNRNKLLSYPNFSESPYYGVYKIGYPLSMSRVLKSRGVDPATGDYYFEDLNGNGKTDIDPSLKTEDDRYILDRTTQYFGGLTNTFSYKNFELSFLLYFKKQIGTSALYSGLYPGEIGNQPVTVLNRWLKPGDITDVPRFSTNPYANESYYPNFRNSDGLWVDASFIRLQNMSISYEIPQRLKKSIALKNGKLFLKVQNMFVISNYDGLDPEVQTISTPPLPRIITGGFSINF